MPLSEWVGNLAHDSRTVQLERMTPLTDEQGGGWQRAGQTFEAVGGKMSARESFFLGQDAIKPTFFYFADLPLTITEHDRLWHPEWGELDVIEAVPIPEEGIVRLLAEDVYQAAGQ